MSENADTEARSHRRHHEAHHWVAGASVIELARRLEVVGPERARLEVYQDGDHITFEVADPDVAEEDETWPPINDSHRCPPDCP